jgi:hypothetical protein
MRKQQHRQAFTSLFTSKRFVVAFCAAIAMVLGAMSVGADTPGPDGPSATPAPPSANRAGTSLRTTSGNDGNQTPNQARVSNPLKRPFLEYQPPITISNEKPGSSIKVKPVVNSPLKNLEIKLNLKPVQAIVAPIISPAVPLLNEVEAVESTLGTAAVPDVVESTLQGTGILPEETVPPATEPNLESPQTAPAQ